MPKRALFLAVLLLSGGLLVSCGRAPGAGAPLTMLAGSELKDLEPYFPEIAQATGVRLAPTYSGTLAGIDRLKAGEHFDVAWFSHAKYLVLGDSTHLIKASERIMLSPVVVGVKAGKARAFGWTGRTVTWPDIGARIKAHEFTFAMTNPATSNSGFSAVIGVATALSGSADALKPSDIAGAKLTSFFSGQKLTAGSSGWLADAYVRDQAHLDGIINYESTLLSLNAGGALTEPLTLIYPKDGIVTADYPLLLLDESRREAYGKLVAYLKSTPFQKLIMEKTHRRPIDASIALRPEFPKTLLVDIAFPNSLATIDAILLRYLNVNRIPPHAFFLIDTSGSMQGERIGEVRKAFDTLAGADETLTGRFARFENREEVTVITFNDQADAPVNFEMHSASDQATLGAVKKYAGSLSPGGNTAIYDAIELALSEAAKAQAIDRNHYASVVLMTDGENNRGDTEADFERKYAQLPPALRAIKVFPIFIGEANPEQLQRIAQLTGGRAFDARNEPLATIFKEIRGYQ